MCDNISVCVINHKKTANHVREWFDTDQQMIFLAPFSPVLNPTEEFFSPWRWKVYDCRPCDKMALLEAMDAVCWDITSEAYGAWLQHAKRFVLLFLRCDVDIMMWPSRDERLVAP